MEGDPTWSPSQTPVIVVGDRIVSTLRIWGHLGTTPVHMGGMGGVPSGSNAPGGASSAWDTEYGGLNLVCG